MRQLLFVRLRRRRAVGAIVGTLIVLFLVLTATAGGDDEDPATGLVADLSRRPDLPLVIPAGEPIIVGVSSALTGPVASRGLEFRDAVVVAVQRWMERNGDEIGGHAISVVAEDDGSVRSQGPSA